MRKLGRDPRALPEHRTSQAGRPPPQDSVEDRLGIQPDVEPFERDAPPDEFEPDSGQQDFGPDSDCTVEPDWE